MTYHLLAHMQIPIRGEDNSWIAAFGHDKRASLKGKQAHMASAAEELQSRWTVEVRPPPFMPFCQKAMLPCLLYVREPYRGSTNQVEGRWMFLRQICSCARVSVPLLT